MRVGLITQIPPTGRLFRAYSPEDRSGQYCAQELNLAWASYQGAPDNQPSHSIGVRTGLEPASPGSQPGVLPLNEPQRCQRRGRTSVTRFRAWHPAIRRSGIKRRALARTRANLRFTPCHTGQGTYRTRLPPGSRTPFISFPKRVDYRLPRGICCGAVFTPGHH